MNKKYQYSLEIVGSCNLRCPSCPVGNMNSRQVAKNMIDKDLFCKIIDKILLEKEADNPIISLFDWGEPTLHPDLPFFINYINQKKMRPRISSNLNVDADFESILRANPYQFKISLSGFSSKNYEITHARGNINKVKSNMYKLKLLKDKLMVSTEIIVGFHVYKNNLKDFDMMKDLCKELKFTFEPDPAQLMPIEKVMSLLSMQDKSIEKEVNFDLPPITEKDDKLINLLITNPISEFKKWKEQEKTSDKNDLCFRKENKLAIRVDGTVPICCGVYGDEFLVADNFLEISHNEIKKRRDAYQLCKVCMKNGVHSNWKLSKKTFINKILIKDNILGKVFRKIFSFKNKNLI